MAKLPEGLLFVAWPAEYRVVRRDDISFINEDGAMYQRDLGVNTDALAKAIKEYNPGSGWQKAEDQ